MTGSTFIGLLRLKNKMNNQIPCTWCGSVMVKRKGPYGEFWGCARYPHCEHAEKDFDKGFGRITPVNVPKRHSNLRGKNRFKK